MLTLSSAASAGRLSDFQYDPTAIPGSAGVLALGRSIPISDTDPGLMWLTPTGVALKASTEILFSDPNRFTASFSYPFGKEMGLGVGFATHFLSSTRVGTQEVGFRQQVANVALRFPITNWLGKKRWVAGVGVRIPMTTHLSITGEIDRNAENVPGLDVGLRSMDSPNSEFTLAIQNLFTQLPWRPGEADAAPTRTLLGFHTHLGNITAVFRNFGGTTLHLGTRYPIAPQWEARVGLDQAGPGATVQTFLTAGAGWKTNAFQLDGVFTQTGEFPGYRTFFSVQLFPGQLMREENFPRAGITARGGVAARGFSPEELARVLRIHEPYGSAETHAETIVVRGIVHPNFKLFINNVEASVVRGGEFAVQIPLNVGPNSIEIEGRHGAQLTREFRMVTRRSRLIAAEEQFLRDTFQKLPREAKEQSEEVAWKLRELRKSIEESYRATAIGTIPTGGRTYISRREVAMWLTRIHQLSKQSYNIKTLTDVTIDDSALAAIRATMDANFFSLGMDNRFRPDDPLIPDDLIRISQKE